MNYLNFILNSLLFNLNNSDSDREYTDAAPKTHPTIYRSP
jgi:hypothetical protein